MNPINQNAAAQYQLQIAVGEDDKLYPAMPTLRDQFAMAALTGLLIRDNLHGDDLTDIAYSYADSMMRTRAATSCDSGAGEQE